MNQYWYLQEAYRKAHLFELESNRARWQQQAHRSPRLSKRYIARLLTALTYLPSQLRSLGTGKENTILGSVRSDPARTNS